MKKFFFMTLLAGLFLLPGCKKESKTDPAPVGDNIIVEALNYGKALYGVDTTSVAAQLANEGWTYSYSKLNCKVYYVDKADSTTYLLYLYADKGVVTQATIYINDKSVNDVFSKGQTIKDFMTHMGQSYTFADKSCAFKMMDYTEGGNDARQTDYSAALNKVNTACDNGDVTMTWIADNCGVTLDKIYSSYSGYYVKVHVGNIVENDNPIIRCLNYCSQFYKADATQTATKLENDEWKLEETTDGYKDYYSSDGGVTYSIYYLRTYFSNNVVTKVMVQIKDPEKMCKLVEGETLETFLGYIGQNYVLADNSWPFLMMAYKSGGKDVKETNYNNALQKVADVCNSGEVGLAWASQSYEGLYLTKQAVTGGGYSIFFQIGVMQ